MTLVYRAYSPSRQQCTTPTNDADYATGVAATRNQHTHVTHQPADWIVQAGTVSWNKETP